MRQRRQGAGDGGGGGGDLPYGGYGGGGGAGDGGYGGGGGGYGGGGYGGYGGGGGGTGAGAGYGGADTPPRGAYGGYGAAPAPAAAAPPRKKSSSSGGAGGGFKVLLLATGSFFVLGLTLLSLHYRSQLNSARRDLERTAVTVSDFEEGVARLESRLRQMESRAREANDRARTAEREAKECRREAERRFAGGGVASGDREELRDSREEVRRLQGLLEEAKEAGGGGTAVAKEEEDDHREEQMEELRERAGELEKRALVLKEHIARESYRSALERFGPGPHDVSVRVELPPDPAYPTIPADPAFTIRLHPLAKMPHAVHLFLEQVAHGLWDGCSFIINADHILQAGAHPGTEEGKGESPDDKMRRFEETKLDVLSYQEYHEEFPHEKYTIGFAGRPGGPDFYINKMDNTRNHGPHGQRHEILSEEADPCFGYILPEGRDVVDRLGLLPRNGSVDPPVLNEPLHILEAKILGAEVPPPRWTVGKDWTAVERGVGTTTTGTTTTGTTTGTTTKGTTKTTTTTTGDGGGSDGGDKGSDGKGEEENSPPGN